MTKFSLSSSSKILVNNFVGENYTSSCNIATASRPGCPGNCAGCCTATCHGMSR